MNNSRSRIRLGWILLLALLLYSIFVTSALQRTRRAFKNLQNSSAIVATTEATEQVAQLDDNSANAASNETSAQAVSIAEKGLWMPIVGARVPQNPMWLPTAPRNYRLGESQGFDFYSDDAGVTVSYGTPVIASDDGVITRADIEYDELPTEEWEQLIATVGTDGATDEQLDILRGRQIWLKTNTGQVLRYAHLSGVRNGIEKDTAVYRGQVIGYAGNSGTDDAVKGTTQGVRLHFEIWDEEGSYFGEGLSREDIQIRSPRLFVGP